MLSVTSIHGWKKETVYIISFFVLIITIILQTLCPLVIVFLNARVLILLSNCLKILQRISDCYFKVIIYMYKWKFPTCIMDIHKKNQGYTSIIWYHLLVILASNKKEMPKAYAFKGSLKSQQQWNALYSDKNSAAYRDAARDFEIMVHE